MSEKLQKDIEDCGNDGLLGYNDDFTQVRLAQRHPPSKEDVHLEDGNYRSYRRFNGVKKADVSISLGNVTMDDPRSLISFFEVSVDAAGEKARLEFSPFDLVKGKGFDDPKISGMALPPDGYDEVTIDPSELKALIPVGGQWFFSRSFNKTYDDLGSKYLLVFTVNVTSKPPPKNTLATADPKPEKHDELVVSPNEHFLGKRNSKKGTFLPLEKTYTLVNVGDSFLSYEYFIHFKCDIDLQAIKKYGFPPPKKANTDTLFHSAGRLRPTGSQAYPLQDNWKKENGIKGVSKDYEAFKMKRIE